MASRKKKATVAEAPPSTPPQSKRRKTSITLSETSINPADEDTFSGKNGMSRTTTRSSSGDVKTNGRKHAGGVKNMTVWDQERCEELFDAYASQENSNIIDPNGFQQFCEESRIDITGIMPFVISWKLGATRVFHITRDQWVHGMKALKVDTIAKMIDILPTLERYNSPDLAEETFSELYHWTFIYLREDGMRKVVDLDTAIPVLQVLFANRENRHIAPFLEFLKQSPPPIKALNKDQWDSFYVFSRSIDEDFSGYSDEASWPILLDDYVSWRKEQLHP